MSRSYSKVLGVLALCGLGVSCRANHLPEVTAGPRPMPQVVRAGDEVRFMFEVADPDGDSMTFAWVQVPAEPAGRFSDVGVQNPTWVAPEVSETMDFSIMVTVFDSEGGGIRATGPSVIVQAPSPQSP
ncbi:hypothetical protein [Myxococcus sp. Y35]|uniref:hypothetical protein n=1 Tax=Pseudomyxococcus flavus TaxID=3115648 RepID=UPI003CF9E6C4